MPTSDQLKAIHALRRSAKLDDDGYRGVLAQVAGVRSAKDLDVGAAGRVIDRLKTLAGQSEGPSKAKGSMRITGPWAGKIRALWITGYNLGVVAERTDAACAAWVKRQTGLDQPSWIADPKEAAAVIEGLKAWIGREAGLAWPPPRTAPRALKILVLNRQWDRLIEAGNPIRFTRDADLADYCGAVARGNSSRPLPPETLTDAELDRVAFALGGKLRKQLAFVSAAPAAADSYGRGHRA